MRPKNCRQLLWIVLLFSAFLTVDWAATEESGKVRVEPTRASDAGSKFSVKKLDGKVRVTIGDQLFTEYDYATYAKPILYPVYGPGQVPMTRNHPMKADVKGEAPDHPHHKSIWFGHGDVNGVSFWHEQGSIVHDKIISVDEDAARPVISVANNWVDKNGKTICTDTTTFAFLMLPVGRAIDVHVVVHASHGDVMFGDTKEGTMAVRTHPNLRLSNSPKHGVTTANGQAINSEGVQGKGVWGKRAKWVDYYGKVNDKTVGIAIFDHPGNLQHPTTWHARDYGLVAANPFGLSHFERKKKGAGNYKLASGEDLEFRYRIVLHRGTAEEARIEELYQQYVVASTAK